MEQKRTHRGHRKSHKRVRGIDWLLNSRFLIILGAIFIFIGIYFSRTTLGGQHGISEMIKGLFAPSAGDSAATEQAGSGASVISVLLLYFIPALVLLTGTLIFSRRSPAYLISLVTAIYLIVIQIKISYLNTLYDDFFYPDFPAATLFLTLPTLLLLANSLLYRKYILPVLTCFYVYISVFLLAFNFFTHLEYFFGFIVLFSLLISWIAHRTQKSVIQLVNFTFAWGFFGLYWFRKLMVNHRTEFIPLFFTFGILIYILFYGMVLFNSAKKEYSIPNWMTLGIIGANLFFYLGTTAYVIITYFNTEYLTFIVFVLMLLHISGLWYLRRYQSTVWTVPHYYFAIVLTALMVPLLFQHNRLIVFTSLLSALMLNYAGKHKDRFAFWVSLISLWVMVLYFFYSWIRLCLPAHLAIAIPDPALIVNGLLIGLIAAGSLGFTTWRLKTSEFLVWSRWFRKKRYFRLVRGMLFFSTYLTLGWLVFSLVGVLTGSLSYTLVSWFIAGSLFIIGVIRYYSNRQSYFKKPALYFAFAFFLLYPIMVLWTMVIYRTSLPLIHSLTGFVITTHYLVFGLVITLWRMTFRRIRQYYHKNPYVQQALEFLSVSYLLFLCFTEYDNLWVILSALQNSHPSKIIENPQVINMFLPYSIIIWIVSFVVFVRAVTQKSRFQRNIAITLFIGMLLKLFAFDFLELSQGTRNILFLALGLFLFGIALIYPRLLKGEPILPGFKRSPSKPGDESVTL